MVKPRKSFLLITSAVTAISLIVGGGYAGLVLSSSTAELDKSQRNLAQIQNSVEAEKTKLKSNLVTHSAKLASNESLLIEQRAYFVELVTITNTWRVLLGIANDDDATRIDDEAKQIITPIILLDSLERGTQPVNILELREYVKSLESQVNSIDSLLEIFDRRTSDHVDFWSPKILSTVETFMTEVPSKNTHASEKTLESLKTAIDTITFDESLFESNNIESLGSLAEIVKKVQGEEKAWQDAETQRIAEQNARRGGGSRSGGNNPNSGGSTGGCGLCGGSDVTGALLSLVNQARAEAGVGSLSYSSTLVNSACAHSKWMLDTGNFAHGTPGVWSGENIAWGYTSAAAVFDGWMNSPGHKANILRERFTQMGVCRSSSGNYWTQQFK